MAPYCLSLEFIVWSLKWSADVLTRQREQLCNEKDLDTVQPLICIDFVLVVGAVAPRNEDLHSPIQNFKFHDI